ncbi:alpha/beta hydrolase [Streptomyces prunicolor]|uniref:Alpha/beta hydrolase n=1 Tax=Streptomyces prunicolor TaxID=67348 RepID=A0ABU4F2M2_9ACTN|nr:alpha/beta hydrolase [Streptomyces prunicolor]MDV7214335.1 alpha/beta hydrolase [Streptomyces prunicolor]
MFLNTLPRPGRLLRALAAAAVTVALITTAGAAAPSPARAATGVQVTKDLAYAPAQPSGTQGHLLDLYVPRSDRPLPLVIFTSGSGWLADSGRQGADRVAAQLNPHGYAVAGVAIRSSGQAQFPAQLYDIKGAIRWLRANAKAYHLDPKSFAIMGDSSGGWTTAMAAVTGDIPALEGDVGPQGPSSAVQAAIPFYPPTDFLQMDAHMLDNCSEFNTVFGLTDCHSDARSPESRLLGCTITACPGTVAAANPLTYIGKRPTPPFLILHGKQDSIVPYHQSLILYDKLAASGDEARLISFPQAGHGTDFAMLSDDATRAGAYEQTARHGRTTPARPVTPTWQTIVSFLEHCPALKSH